MCLQNTTIYIPIFNPALTVAGRLLESKGFSLAAAPSLSVTHLLLPVPSFERDGKLRGGGDLEQILQALPNTVIIFGGNLNHPALADYRTVDLLQDPNYVTENAAITAHCAIREILDRLPTTLAGQEVLVIGWGRIGKCLGRLLRGLDAKVTVAARKEADRALARSMSYGTADPAALASILPRFRVILNTAPARIFPDHPASIWVPEALKLELSSQDGLPGADVIPARGLPGKDAPESSGTLIADTVCNLLQKECRL